MIIRVFSPKYFSLNHFKVSINVIGAELAEQGVHRMLVHPQFLSEGSKKSSESFPLFNLDAPILNGVLSKYPLEYDFHKSDKYPLKLEMRVTLAFRH